MRQGATHHLYARERQERPFVGPRASVERLPVRGCAHLPWVGEQDPDRVERNSEEVPEQQEWGLRDAGSASVVSKGTRRDEGGGAQRKVRKDVRGEKGNRIVDTRAA